MSALTPALRELADRAAARTLTALHDALHAGPQQPPGALAGRLVPHLKDLAAPALARLRAPRAAARAAEQAPARVRPALRWPASLVHGAAAPNYHALDLRLLSLRCDDDTHEAGADEMSIGLVRVVIDHGDPVTQATDVQGPFALGKFREGDARTFSPPTTLTSVTPGSGLRTVTAVLVLAEVDLGGLGGLLSAMASGVTDELLLELAERLIVTEGAIAGATFFGTLGSIFGPAGTAGGIAVGVALGGAVGYAVGKVFAGIVHAFKDDPLDPIDWTLALPASAAAGPVEARQLAFSGHGAAYRAALEWRAR